MLKAICKIRSNSPIQFGQHYVVDTLDNENKNDYEKRTWRERGHYDDKNNAVIPSSFFKRAIEEAAKLAGRRIPGQGKATYTKHFLSGIQVEHDINLKVKKDKIEGKWVFVSSDGTRGGSSRVSKCFPTVPKWEGTLEVTIFTDKITKEIFTITLKEAGLFTGLGVYRPLNGGTNGRFEVISIKFEEVK